MNEWKQIKNEILTSYFVSDLTKEICPHLPETFQFFKFNVIHQTIEKFDGDISKISKIILHVFFKY